MRYVFKVSIREDVENCGEPINLNADLIACRLDCSQSQPRGWFHQASASPREWSLARRTGRSHRRPILGYCGDCH